MPPSTSPANRIYVRARYYRSDLTRWQTVDPIWPDQPAYEYCDGSPTLESDPSGFQAGVPLSLCLLGPGRVNCAKPSTVRTEGDCKRCFGNTVPSRCHDSAIQNAIRLGLSRYCKGKCPNLTLHTLTCMMNAESSCDPEARTGDNYGLFQISSGVWNSYCKDLGPYSKNKAENPILNALCAVEALCSHYKCNPHRWGTHTGPGTMYDCCKKYGA